MRYLQSRDINRAQWDALVTAAPNGLIYGLSWYLDVVSPGWEALVKEEQGRYVAVLPLPVRRKFGLRYVQQPSFTQQLGLFYVQEPTAADWQEIGQQLRRRFRLISKYAFNTGNPQLLAGNQLGMTTAAVFATYHLPLRPTYSELLAGYKPNRRWRLNQARRRPLRLEPTTDINLLVQLFADNVAYKINGLLGEEYEYRLLRALYAAASERGLTAMWQARGASGDVVAMILLFRFKNQFTYIFSGATPAGKQAGAITVLLDEVFRTYAGQDLCFDFEALDVANLVSFYSSFGSHKAPFLTISRNQLPWPVRQLKAARMALYGYLRRRQD